MRISTGRTDVIVVGAGISGLACARKLVKAGLSVRLVEARDRIGGRAHTISWPDGSYFEEGCSFVHGMAWNPLRPIFEDKLGVELVPNDESLPHLFQGGEELSAERAKRTAGAAFRAFFEDTRQQSIEGSMPAQGSTIAAAIEKTFAHLDGADAHVARMLTRAVSGWTGADLENGFEQDHVGTDALPIGGYHQLVEWLETEILHGGGVIEIADAVSRVTRTDDHVRVQCRSRATYEADFVVSTLSLGLMQAGTVTFEPELPPRKIASLTRLGMGTLNKVYLGYDRAYWPQDDRPAMIVVPKTDNDPLLAGARASAIWALASDASLCVFVGGSVGEHLEALSDADAVAWAHRTMSQCARVDATVNEPVKSRVTKWKRDPLALGSYSYLPADTGATPLDMIELSRAVWDDRLGFAGEATDHDLFVSLLLSWLC